MVIHPSIDLPRISRFYLSNRRGKLRLDLNHLRSVRKPEDRCCESLPALSGSSRSFCGLPFSPSRSFRSQFLNVKICVLCKYIHQLSNRSDPDPENSIPAFNEYDFTWMVDQDATDRKSGSISQISDKSFTSSSILQSFE